jgi:hypothetical protein
MSMKKYLPLIIFCLSLPAFAASDAVVEGRSDYMTIIQPRAFEELKKFRNRLESAYGYLLSDETVDWSHLPQSHIESLWNDEGEWPFKQVLEQLIALEVGDTHEKSKDFYDFVNQKLCSGKIMKKMKDFKEKLKELELSLEFS